MTDPEYYHVVDQIKGDIRDILATQQEIGVKVDRLHDTVMGNGKPETSLIWRVKEIEEELKPHEGRSFRHIVIDTYAYMRGQKITWSKIGGIALAITQAVIVAKILKLI